ncbi:MAG: hypothetical protein EOO53_21245 [Gammaproteobacteria bacterium]|nr:MAG: hypothetical protein EOO53_21245 [Gammaproteobacteria bacterium]
MPDPDYKTRLTQIPQFLKDHFPDHLPKDGTSTLITNTDTTSHCIYYFLLQYGNDFVSQLDTTNIGQLLAIYDAADSNIISIKRETVTYWNPEKKKSYTDKIRDNKYYYPVPYFETNDLPFYKGDVKNIYSDKTLSGLSEGFKIHVLDFKTGNYWQGLKPLDYLPEGWQNGYSKGVAINKDKNVLIHWFIVW